MWSLEMPREPNSSPKASGPRKSRLTWSCRSVLPVEADRAGDVRLGVERRVLVDLDDADRVVVEVLLDPLRARPARPSRSRPRVRPPIPVGFQAFAESSALASGRRARPSTRGSAAASPRVLRPRGSAAQQRVRDLVVRPGLRSTTASSHVGPPRRRRRARSCRSCAPASSSAASRAARPRRRAAHQPQQDRDVVQRVAQRADAVGIADPALARRPPRSRAGALGAGHDRTAWPSAVSARVSSSPRAAAADQQRPHASRRASAARALAQCASSEGSRGRRRRPGTGRRSSAAARRARARGVHRLEHLARVAISSASRARAECVGRPAELLGAGARYMKRPRADERPGRQKPAMTIIREGSTVRRVYAAPGASPPSSSSLHRTRRARRAGLPGRARRNGRLPAAPRAAR